ncbi:hypothetical protein M0804_010405 [Polistes exclamans]|nr:hypothetical protein M0804_010405 [Polistes exclamans]
MRPLPRWDLWYQSSTLIGYALPRDATNIRDDEENLTFVIGTDMVGWGKGVCVEVVWISSAAPLRELVLLGTKLEQRPPDLRCEYGPIRDSRLRWSCLLPLGPSITS